MADTADLKSATGLNSCVGSSPTSGTKTPINMGFFLFAAVDCGWDGIPAQKKKGAADLAVSGPLK